MQYRQALQLVADHSTVSLARRFIGHPVLGIINGRAGTTAKHRLLLRVVENLTPAGSERTKSNDDLNVSTVWTDTVDALHEVMARWIRREYRSGGPAPIVVSFGGDGTHNQVLQAVDNVPEVPSEGIWYFRVPLGSGNDAVGVESLEDVLDSLQGELAPRWIPEVEVVTPRRTLRAFNIASVGIDAFVTMMHHRLRKLLPGNTYRLIANAALLIYEKLVNLGPMSIVSDGEDLGTGDRILVAFGVHGHLTYGDHIRILPNEENLCIFNRASLLVKLKMKKLLMHGNHVHETVTTMRKTSEITIRYDRRITVQVDGEADWLEPEDFPLVMRTRDRSRKVLQPARFAEAETRI